jgi:hypothetical protein
MVFHHRPPLNSRYIAHSHCGLLQSQYPHDLLLFHHFSPCSHRGQVMYTLGATIRWWPLVPIGDAGQG